MDPSHISYSVEANVATITLNRPDRLNAFTDRMRRELLDAFDRVDADDDVRAVIITGAGRAFCAGADLGAGAQTFTSGGSRIGEVADADARGDDDASDDHRDGGGTVSLRVYECLKPVIAAINGPAVGVGVTMTLPMDIRIASSDAKFGFVFARRGIVLEACSSWFLPRLVGISQAAEWAFTGRVFGADEAKAGGLIRSVHAPDELLGAARAIAAEIVEHTAPISVAVNRQLLWRMLGAEHPMVAHRADSKAMVARGRSADAAEGVTSFLEKRPARFPGRVSDGLPNIFP